MMATARTLAIMLLAPPLVLLLWAHFVRPVVSGLDVLAVLLAGIMGLAGVATAPWSARVKGTVAVAYIGLAVAALPFMTLLAVCSTGDCL